jgi:hypothetical protein
MAENLALTYYSDVLCVWAHISQARVDEVAKRFADDVSIDYRFCSVFGDTAHKIGIGWAERGGYAGFGNLSVLNIATPRNCWAFLPQLCLTSHSFYGKIEERISLCFGAEMAQDLADDAGPAQSRDAAPSLYCGHLAKP